MRMVKRLLPFVVVLGAPLLLCASAFGAFGLQSAEMSVTNRDGSPDLQAGSHPYELVSGFYINDPERVNAHEFTPSGALKDVSAELPPGFVGNPNAVPKCSPSEFSERNPRIESQANCLNDTVVGYADVFLTARSEEAGTFEVFPTTSPIYNMQTPPGEPAEFAFNVLGLEPVFMHVSVRAGGDYGLTVTSRNIADVLAVYGVKIVMWGVPADSSHDALRGECVETNAAFLERSRGSCPVSLPLTPFLTNPTSCGVPRTGSIGVDDWDEPGALFSRKVSMPELGGCERLPFAPALSVAPDAAQASTPSGLSVDLHVPQESTENPAGLAEADVKNTSVTLPEGMALNPSAADGLGSCSEAQFGLHSGGASACPVESKVGTVEIDTPLLPEPLVGSAYLATPDENPFGSLVALYVVAENATYGVRVKVAGQVGLDPASGQLTASFKETPQLPFSDFKLHFFGTARAPLATPGLCGSYTTRSAIEPWSESEVAQPASTFQITAGPGGSACPPGAGFAPALTAGSTNVHAGAFSPFTMTMSREDGQQPLQSVQLHLPPGLLGMVSSVAECGQAQADAGTCGPASLIGKAIVSVGLGNDPYTVSGGRVYLTGPYEGAPYGLSIVTPAKAGPFDLGQVVVRAKIDVDPVTAALTVTTDSSGPYRIPTILDGIPLQVKHVNVTIDRAGFTFNPTNCDPLTLTGSIASAQGSSSTLSVPFQVTDCAALAFKPIFSVSTSGKTSRRAGASLHVKLSYPPGAFGNEANIASVKVDLPKQLPSRLSTLQKACPVATFQANPVSCPAGSMVGSAKASTPVLAGTLSGPAYFVSYAGLKFPELVVVLQGDGVRIDLHGETFIGKAGITSSTFHTIPDVPVSAFELTLPQGPGSALAANGSLCASKLGMPSAFTAQNGMVIDQTTPIHVTGCAKRVHHVRSKSHRRKK